jgi:hypothetical protein
MFTEIELQKWTTIAAQSAQLRDEHQICSDMSQERFQEFADVITDGDLRITERNINELTQLDREFRLVVHRIRYFLIITSIPDHEIFPLSIHVD